MKEIKGRLNRSLGDNALREYLADKKETGKNPSIINESFLVKYCLSKKNIKTLLIYPCLTIPKNMQKRCLPPLGLCYIASALEKENIDVSIIDSVVEGWDIERIDEDLITYGLPPNKISFEESYDVIGISVPFSVDIPNVYELINCIKKKMPNAIIVVGGLHPSIYPKEVFEPNPNIDFILRGEGEHRFVNFVKLLSKGFVDKNADGLVGKINGEFICNPQVNRIENLDSLPFPAFHLLPIEKYFDINVPFSPVPLGDRVLPILTSRGCPCGCSFCASTNFFKKYKSRSAKNVMAEINFLKDKYQIDEIQFADDNLTFDMDMAMKKFIELKKINIKWCTPNGVMINKLDNDMIQLMAESGLYQITLSIDSVDKSTLSDRHHKAVNIDIVPSLIKKCRECHIFTHGTFVVGMEGETIEDIKQGFEYIKNNLELTSISVFIASAIPGSELYHESIDKKRISKAEAMRIDTTKSKVRLSSIDSFILEEMVEDFYKEYFNIIKDKYPKEIDEKYNKLT